MAGDATQTLTGDGLNDGTRAGRSTCNPQPPALVLHKPAHCHTRTVDSRVFAILSATSDVATIGHCSHI
jgi:hypothetical protein